MTQKVIERAHARRDALWERFMRGELREMEKRKDGQLAELLGEALPGEPPAARGGGGGGGVGGA